MKKYKQVMAALLAMNLTVYVMPTGVVKISASVESQSNEDTTEKTQTEPTTESVGESDTAENISVTAADSAGAEADAVSDADDSSETEPTETPASDSADTDVEITDEDTEDSEDIPDIEISDEADADALEGQGENELFSDGVQEEENVTTDVQADESDAPIKADGTVELEQLLNYDSTTKTMKITASQDLILLSHCDPKKIQKINIYFYNSGDINVSESNTNKITSGKNISEWFKSTSTASVNEAENTEPDMEISEQNEEEESSVIEDNSESGEETAAADNSQDIAVQSTITAPQDYTYQGIGNADFPFQGYIYGETKSVTVDQTFFGGLSSSVTYPDNWKLSVIWRGNGTIPMAADVYQFDAASEEGFSLPITISGDSSGTMGSLIGTVRETTEDAGHILNIGDTVTYYDKDTKVARKVGVTPKAGDAGFICNTLSGGTIRIQSGYQYPTGTSENKVKIQSADGNAGGLVGVLGNKACLRIETDLTLAFDDVKSSSTSTDKKGNVGGLVGMLGENAKIQVQSKITFNSLTISGTANAGGLVGLMQKSATISTEGAVELTSPDINGAVSAGGVAGTAENANITGVKDSLEITTPIAKGTTADSNAGGFIGHCILTASNQEESTYVLPECLNLTSPTASASGNYGDTGGDNIENKDVANTGGYFGYLELSGKWNCTFGNTDAAKVEFTATHGDSGNRDRSYGAIAGKVTSSTIESTIKVQNMDITSIYKNKTVYHGGLIGELGTKGKSEKSVYMKTSNVGVTVTNPYADGTERGFGGLVGCLGQGSILRVEGNTTISTNGSDPKIWEGGGIVGHADKRSVLELSGNTDLSGVKYVGSRKEVGWLVGYQDCALIYARGDGNRKGWTYKRGYAKNQFDVRKYVANDIANYGQIIRLQADGSESRLSSSLITINDTNHAVTLGSLSLSESEGITLGSADDFALLSIAWNSRGYFSPDSNIGPNEWGNLKGKTIKMSQSIDLTGSGITGLSRDNNNDSNDIYKGIFDGQGNTLTLDIGEIFGSRDDGKNTDGCGTVYAIDNYHAALGIFAKTQGATITNVVLDGNINLSNKGSNPIVAGGIAGYTLGKTTINKVTAKETITADCSGATGTDKVTQNLSVGGFYGEGSGGDVTLQNDTKASANISLVNTGDKGSYAYAGEILGQITSDGFTLAVNGLTVGGSTESENALISTDATDYAYVGGLIGIIKPITKDGTVTNTIEENRWIEIRNLTFNNFAITANEVTEACGGLFGSIWANVGVYFMGEKDADEGAYAGKTKMTVKNSSISAQKASGVGGLAYRSSGIWEIRDKGIDIQSIDIKAKGDVGLLICRGEKGEEGEDKTAENVFDLGAVYVRLTENWADVYNLATDNKISVENIGIFDEFVAHTAANSAEITYNGDNGVISLATAESGNERAGVEEDTPDNCTTYQNRTAYGQTHNTNACSRYYYDLDQCWNYLNSNREKGTDNIIDDPRELMLWSVYRYASDNIKHFFIDAKNANGNVVSGVFSDLKDCNTIGANSGTAIFNMKKYSYYPIDISNDVTVKNAEITFYNEQIETAESNNKSTQAKNQITQHYTMHCGLFLNQLQVKRNTTVTVDTVTFKGSIGKISSNGNSGVLFAGNVSGTADTQLYIATVILKEITFAGLKVNECETGYAPLLINSIGSYATLDVNGIKTQDYTEQTAVASSLIGNVGSNDGKQINLSFLNITLPDMPAGGNDGIFSHATLLESFKHDGTSSVATYNFYMDDEWKNGSYTHGVTYGREITESVEYRENGESKQLWYYDEENYGSNTNRVHTDADDLTGFSSVSYLPYVCEGFNESNRTHEIKVNQRVIDITHGCGTYSHPYKITSEREMNILSEYMATGTARTDWRVTITNSQSSYHVSGDTDKYSYSGDKTYQFDGTEWIQVTKKTVSGKEVWESVKNSSGDKITLSREFMLQYLLNAYYDLQGSGTEKQLKLDNFGGFGISTRPFRGVLTSSNGTTVVLSGTSTSNGLIPYSYGSVVKDLVISYEKGENTGKTLTYDDTKTSEYYQDECFGGVIGCVLGGDNIIDNVTVQMESGWLTLAGDKAHLIQVGGYVGSVSGGGVIFRDMPKGTGLADGAVSGITGIAVNDKYDHMYVNPYVGRVLDGFAFYEVSDTNKYEEKLENSNKNYEINTLNTSKTDSVTVDENNTVTVKDAQGLLILSAIVNSGAASGGANNAYSNMTDNTTQYSTTGDSVTYSFAGKYGKVRNASYGSIKGTAEDTEKTLSMADDQTKPGTGSMPYLIKKYCKENASIFSLCSSGIKIKLSGESYDMTGYGKGFQGFGVRYVSNAILSGNNVNAKGILPELSSFEGKSTNSIVTIDTQVNEYVDDDFKTASVGGLFNLLRVGSDGTVSEIKNLTICGKKNEETNSYSGVVLQYYNSNGSTATVENCNVDVGAFAGAVSGLSATSGKTTGKATFESVTLQNLNIDGPQNAGGLLGSSKRTDKLEKNTNGTLRETGTALLFKSLDAVFSVGITAKNTEHDNITVTAANATGGFVGYIDNDADSSLIVTTKDNTYRTGKDSKIGKSDNNTTAYAGGAFGYVKRSDDNVGSSVNLNTGGTEEYQYAVMQNVTVKATECAGGFFGKIDGKTYQINKAEFTGNSAKAMAVISADSAAKYAGGIIGLADGRGSDCTLQSCKATWAEITEKNTASTDSGVTSGHGGIAGRIQTAQITVSDCTVQETSVTGGKAGGIIGNTAVRTVIKGCKVLGADNKKYELTGSETAGGIIGLSNAGSAKIQMEQCKVRNMTMLAKNWGCGGMLGDVDWNAVLDTLYLFDCAVENSEVSGNNNSGTTAGGFVGDIRGKLKAADLLLSGVTIHTKSENKVGMVIGMADSRTGGTATDKEPGIVSVAGLSIQNVHAYCDADSEKKSLTQLYGVIADATKDTTEDNMKKYSYFAFADYTGTASAHQENDDKTLVGETKEISPYVVTSPKSLMAVYESEDVDAASGYLYGDGSSWGTDNKLVAETIWGESKNGATAGHYAYNNITDSKNAGYVKDFDFSTAFSTYNENQSVKASTDFPVLQISGGDTTKVTDYLNIVTNGAFSIASNTSTTSVTVTEDVYKYVMDADSEKGKFIKDSTMESPLKIETRDGKIAFSTTTDYDNDKNRFTLLTVTFTEMDIDGETEHKYNVMVPVIVRRMLEVDFSATLSYGTNFRESDYENLSAHVLESFGSSITGYLKYTYNSEMGTFRDYGWQSYINAGGDVAASLNKSIWFDQNVPLPEGTQLSLVDSQNGKVYYYTATGEENNKIAFSAFVNSDGDAYEAPSIAELMKAKVEKNSAGIFVKVEEDGRPAGTEISSDKTYPKPTVRIGDDYYRLAGSDDTGGDRYSVTVTDTNLKDGDVSDVTESFYLVITVPKDSKSSGLNGILKTEIEKTVPNHINYMLINGVGEEGIDPQGNSPSTYVISSGYNQVLNESSEVTLLSKKMSAAETALNVDVIDTITFPNKQIYQDTGTVKDELYQRFVGSLQKTVNGKTSAAQFPSGTTGNAQFYVYTEIDGTRVYYIYRNGVWKPADESGDDVAVSYTWTSDGRNMELPLADGTIDNIISLQGARKLVKDATQSKNKDAETSTFYVEVKMEASIPATGLDVIPESEEKNNLPVDYAKLTYSSQLSTETQSLTYSTNRASEMNTLTKYYREEPTGAKLTYEADLDKIGQLGINLLDLQYQDEIETQYSMIDTNATYDLTNMKNLDTALKDSNGIRFTLNLLPKNTIASGTSSLEDYQEAVKDAKQYLEINLRSKASGEVKYSNGTWSWTVPKTTYWDDTKKTVNTTNDVFNGTVLTQDIQLKVRIDNVEAANVGHYYSNYRVVLTAEILKNDGTVMANTHLDDNIIYTLAKIKPEFID
ncbi:hypothetical protein [Blautia sp. MSJ-19]|uniref:hypothetical protein n=1 Tax=Blautia sp. MSJ-19 TaxID=2841517 RepID=UPI001C0F1385|nr:hypothetical protein [Blautia sp. MSJ-19]MBU5480535.1 hypothetical protein [Blautia sp. MSJ-19]